jgi:hypothetical protein
MPNNVTVRYGSKGARQVASEADKLMAKFNALRKESAKGIAIGAGAAITNKALGMVGSAISGVTGFLEDSVAAYREQEVATNRLSASLRANTTDWIGHGAAIEEATKASMALGFTDTETANAIALLVAATHSQAEAIKVLSVAQDLARFKSISLSEAAQALTGIEAGRARGLALLGINVKDYATTEERLAAVEKVTGDQARKYAESDLGKLDKATARVDQAQEKFGKGLSHLEADILPAAADALETVAGAVDGLQTSLDTTASATDRLKAANDFWSNGLVQAFVPGANLAKGALDGIDESALTTAAHMVPLADDVAEAARVMHGAAKNVASAWTPSLREFEGGLVTIQKDLAKTPAELGKALIDGQDEVERGMQTLIDAMKHPLSTAKRIAHLEGMLTGKELARGLRSTDPIIKTDAQALRTSIEAELLLLRQRAPGYGAKTAKAYADGLRGQYGYVHDAAVYVTKAAVGAFKASSPPGPESPLHEIDTWGEKTGQAWADGLARGTSGADFGLGDVAASMPGGPRPGGGIMAGTAVGGGQTNLHFHFPNAIGMTPGGAELVARLVEPIITRSQQKRGLFGAGAR